jgi:predicted KAP-like P-loop ATPase
MGHGGDGKTTVLRMVEEYLEAYPPESVAIVRFNAWFYGSEEEIIKEFFTALASGLDSCLCVMLKLTNTE